MILDFADTDTAQVFAERRPKKYPPDILTRALSKLRLIDAAAVLTDLRVPPGNQLEALKDDRKGQHSIRINDQWRICFVWQEADENKAVVPGARRVEIVDWVLSKVADARARAARIRENAEKMAREAEADADSLLFRYGPALQDFARRELTGKKKSLRLFHGVIGYRTRPASVSVTDERAALQWAQANLPAAAVVRLDKAALSAALLESGEVVSGCQLVPADEIFYVK